MSAWSGCKSCARLKERQQELLTTIRKLSSEIPYPEEANNAAVLIAKVGTLRAQLNELIDAVLDRSHFEALELARSMKTVRGPEGL